MSPLLDTHLSLSRKLLASTPWTGCHHRAMSQIYPTLMCLDCEECRENQRLYIKDGMHIKASALAFWLKLCIQVFGSTSYHIWIKVWSADSSANSDVNMLLNQLMLDISIWESVRIRGTAHLAPIPLSFSPEQVVGWVEPTSFPQKISSQSGASNQVSSYS